MFVVCPQLEDDILADVHFVTRMTQEVARQTGHWILLQLSSLGFIGRLFKSSDVPKMFEFLLMFHTQKPCDWLMDDYLRTFACGHGEKWQRCLLKIRKIARPIKPSLFQHMGKHSSFKGSVNKLKDKDYGRNSSSHQNPLCEDIISFIPEYKTYSLYSAYMGEGYFWGSSPKTGDVIDFVFDPPIRLSRIKFSSGDKRRPGDIFKNTSVEVLSPVLPEPGADVKSVRYDSYSNKQNNEARKQRALLLSHIDKKRLLDTFYTIGQFDERGVANAIVPSQLRAVQVVRIHVHSAIKNWVILNSIQIYEDKS